jgi:hypothetical protein
VTVRNDGELPVVISRLHLEVDAALQLGEECDLGIGGNLISTVYDIEIPGDKDGGPPTAPITVPHDLSFEVAPRSADRFSVAFGPQYEKGAYLLTGRLTLEQDNGERLTSEPFASAVDPLAVWQLQHAVSRTPAGSGEELSLADIQMCAGRAASTIDEAAGDIDTWSPELQSLSDTLREYSSTEVPERSATIAETRAADWESFSRYIAECDAPSVVRVAFHDVAGSPEAEAIVHARCPQEAGPVRDALYVVDGASASESPRWLVDAFSGYVGDDYPNPMPIHHFAFDGSNIVVHGQGVYPPSSPRAGEHFRVAVEVSMQADGNRSTSEPFVPK